MRPDMGKVLTERPRNGGYKKVKGYKKELSKSLADETTITKESMVKPWLKGWDAKVNHKTDVLGPLKGYIKSKEGCKWDDVYSEIRDHINADTTQGSHLLDHLYQMVERYVVLADGRPYVISGRYDNESGYLPLESTFSYKRFYVCPESGLLKLAPYEEAYKKKKQVQNWVWKDKEKLTQYRLVPCGKTKTLIWFEVQLAPLRYYWGINCIPDPKRVYTYKTKRMHHVYDAVLKRDFSDDHELSRIYGGNYYGVSKRQINKKEIANLKKDAA